jgi:hypothetical protein
MKVKNNQLRIKHGQAFLEIDTIHRKKNKGDHMPIFLPRKFEDLLIKKCLKFGVDCLDFTYAYDEQTGIHSIAITFPSMKNLIPIIKNLELEKIVEKKVIEVIEKKERDNFKRKTGYDIVKGRIKRMKGEIRDPYEDIPKYIFIERGE